MGTKSSGLNEVACIRQVANWSKLLPQHKFDKPTFNAIEIKEQLSILSPKLDQMLKKIQEFDTADFNKYGKTFKHVIYSDLKTYGFGAKAIAAALSSHGYKHAYDKTMKLDAEVESGKNSFAVLCSTPIYDKPIGVKFRNSLLSLFNSRPDNVYGDRIRFLVIDQGYREGIDVFDIKYIHLLEPSVSESDKKQVVGRGTRFCGQKGLHFNPTKGWRLHVIQYDQTLPETIADEFGADTLSSLYLKELNIDMSMVLAASAFEQIAKFGAVDNALTQELHRETVHPGEQMLFVPPARKIIPPVYTKRGRTVSAFGRKYFADQKPSCIEGCTGMFLPVPTTILMFVYIKIYGHEHSGLYPMRMLKPKSFLCSEIKTNAKYCDELGKCWRNPVTYVGFHSATVFDNIKKGEKLNAVSVHMMYKYIRSVMKEILIVAEPGSPRPPRETMGHFDMEHFIRKNFSKYVWPKMKVENLCIEPLARTGGSSVVEFSPTQNFVRQYFQSSSIYKGMLLWHSVGTGKTCTAIATATTSFEKEGYTILWVTRHTLKADIWKNMFDSVCSLVLQERLKTEEGFTIPRDPKAKMRLLSNAWMPPMSYKQFSNMLAGKNALHKMLVDRNGKDDPLKKTLVIIDEAHKLFASDMVGNEKPDVELLKRMIHKSYAMSGESSTRLLLLTATPYSTNPIDLVRLLNLLRPTSDQLPELFKVFKDEFMTNDGAFTKEGSESFLHKISGYVSYLNRGRDIRQFAQPVFTTVTVPLSENLGPKTTEDVQKVDAAITELHDLIGKLGTSRKKEVVEERKDLKEKANMLKKQKKAFQLKLDNEIKNDLSGETALRSCMEKSKKRN